MHIVRPVSGHASPILYLKLAPLHSRRITGVHRYYGHPQLPSSSTLSLAQLGRSKEKRSDCPLVTLVLVLDGDGFPLGSQIFPGNASEPTTLARMPDRLRHNHLSDATRLFTWPITAESCCGCYSLPTLLPPYFHL